MSKDVLNRLRNTLLECGPFDSEKDIRPIFIDARLSQWAASLPESTSRQNRVEQVIYYLHDKHNKSGDSALVLLLQILCERVDSEDSCRSTLTELANKLKVEPILSAEFQSKDSNNVRSGDFSIEGNVGPGAAIGAGANVSAENIAGRDIIIAERDVYRAEGNITVIGTNISIPHLIQGAVIVTALIIVVWVVTQIFSLYQEPELGRMVRNINIAVIRFGVTGNIQKDQKEDLEQRYEEFLERAVSDVSEDLQDSPVEIWPPSKSNSIVVNNDENAAQFAETINAHIVVYGTIDLQGQTEGAAIIRPKIYIAPHFILDEGAEVSGSHRLGNEIFVPNVNAVNAFETGRENFKNLIQSLIDISIGLNLYKEGNYEASLENYLEAKKRAEDNTGWENPDVIYLFLGNSALKLNQLDKAEKYYQDANRAYQNNLGNINGNYSRALIGLGSVAYLSARNGAENNAIENINLTAFDKALQRYNEALYYNDIEELPVANIEMKAYFGLGQTYLQKAVVEQFNGLAVAANEDYRQAEEKFEFIIDKYNSRSEDNRTQLAELSAWANANIGLIEYQRSNFDKAVEYYEYSLTITLESRWNCTEPVMKLRANSDKKLFYLYIEKLNQPDVAITWLSDAIENPAIHCSNRERLDWYQKHLKSLQSNQSLGGFHGSKNTLYHLI